MIFVDNFRQAAKIGHLHRRWSHLFAFPRNDEELHIFASTIGLARSWFQTRKILPHYDVTEWQRDRALEAGAKSATREEVVQMMQKERSPE